MGNGCAVQSSASIIPDHRDQESRSSKIAGTRCNTTVSCGLVHNRITSALIHKKDQMLSRQTPITFSKIILRVHKLRNVKKHVANVFKTIAKNSDGLNLDGLQECMHQLHCGLTKEETIELFDFVDIYELHSVKLIEFWVALTVGYILEAIPALANPRTPQASTEEITQELTDSQAFEKFIDMSAQIQELLSLIVMAYLLFDPEGKGYIVEEALGKVLAGDHAMLEARFREMDCDSNGTIDFGEFVFTFTSWIDSQNLAESSEEDM